MAKIKICYVIVNCKIAGPMNQTLNIIRNLDKKVFDAAFVTLFDEVAGNSMIESYKKECCFLGCLGLSKVNSLIIGSSKLKKVLEDYKPDIVHSVGMPAYRMALSYKKAKPLVTMRNYMYEDYPSHYNKVIGTPLAFLDMNLLNRQIKKGEHFVCCSKSLSDIYFEKQNLSLPYIRNGVEIQKYPLKDMQNTNNIRKKLGLPLDGKIIIYTGTFSERKNQEEAMVGFINSNSYNDNYLLFCGDRNNYEELKEKYKNYPHIIFAGRVSNISEYLQASDLYISTSKSEGMPNGVLEAMASGLGVLLSDIPQHIEVMNVGEGYGKIYKLGNVRELSDKIDAMIMDDICKMGKVSHSVCMDNFTAMAMSNNYQHLYKDMYEEKLRNI